MPSINKNDWWEDRRTPGGKGDLHRGGQPGYRAATLWGRSDCCNAPVARINGKDTCEKCLKTCQKVK